MAQVNKFHVLQGLDGKRVVLFDKKEGFDASTVLREDWNDRQIKEAIAKGVAVEGHFSASTPEGLTELEEYRKGITQRRNLITGKKYVKTELVSLNPDAVAAQPRTIEIEKIVEVEKEVIVEKQVGLPGDVVVKLFDVLKTKTPKLIAAQTVEDVTSIKGWEAAAEVLGVEASAEAVLEAVKK